MWRVMANKQATSQTVDEEKAVHKSKDKALRPPVKDKAMRPSDSKEHPG